MNLLQPHRPPPIPGTFLASGCLRALAQPAGTLYSSPIIPQKELP
jgi:hypothetical protein